jgi:hypothetical protein
VPELDLRNGNKTKIVMMAHMITPPVMKAKPFLTWLSAETRMARNRRMEVTLIAEAMAKGRMEKNV